MRIVAHDTLDIPVAASSREPFLPGPARPVLSLRVTYDPEVGVDTWYLYFDPDTSALVGYRFYHDESANDGEYIVLEGEVSSGTLRLPKARTWYTHGDDRLLGTDTLTSLAGTELR